MLRFGGEALRQAGILILGSAVVIWGLAFILGLQCGIEGAYFSRSVGAPANAGTFAAWCDLREIMPYAFGYMMSAKVGTGLVAEIGAMRISDEIDALEVIGINSLTFLCATRLLGAWLVLPAIYVGAVGAGFFASYLAVVQQIGEVSSGGYFVIFWMFQNPPDLLYSLVKGMAMATVIVLVGCYYGYTASGGPVGVGTATAKSMVANTVMVHLIGHARHADLLGLEPARADRRLGPSGRSRSGPRLLEHSRAPRAGGDPQMQGARAMPSDDHVQRSRRVSPGGIHSQRRQTDPPLCLTRAKGGRVWDSAGRQYVDFHNAYGCIVLGHGDARVNAAVGAALDELDLVGLGVTPAEVELAETLVSNVPCFEQVLLCNTGSEATLHAVRLARAVTGRSRVVKFQGAYHGTHDYLLSNSLAPSLRGGGPNPDPQAGVFAAAVDATIVCRYNDLESVRTVAGEHPDEIAAIVVEPYGHNIGGAAPLPGFLEGLRLIADQVGAVLVFDEVITGIRHGLGGYQELSGVTPDVSTLAKALGNGLPIAAIGGRQDYMEQFNTSPSGQVLYSGTFNGGGGPVAAALATIEALSAPGSYERLADVGHRMRRGLRQIFADHEVTAQVTGIGSVFHLFFAGEGPVVSQEDVARNDTALYVEFRRQMMANGVLDTPETQGMRSYASLGHSDEDIDLALDAAAVSIKAALETVGR